MQFPGRSGGVPESGHNHHHHHNNTCSWCAWYQALAPLFSLWRRWRPDPAPVGDCSLVRCGARPPSRERISRGKPALVVPAAVYLFGTAESHECGEYHDTSNDDHDDDRVTWGTQAEIGFSGTIALCPCIESQSGTSTNAWGKMSHFAPQQPRPTVP